MSAIPRRAEIEYPSSDGKPMAENTIQFQWIQVLSGNFAALFRDRADVFVGGDLLWYPREGDNTLCQAPDVFVVFGRPKRHRKSYKQWEEGDTSMTVVIEVLSESNKRREMGDKLAFYDLYGVEEYWEYDPEGNAMLCWFRGRAALKAQRRARRYVSPRLGVTFDLSGPELAVYHPDGRRFLTFADLEAERADIDQRATTAEVRATTAEEREARTRRQMARLGELATRLAAGAITPEEMTEFQALVRPDAG